MEVVFRSDVTWETWLKYINGQDEDARVVDTVDDWIESIDGVPIAEADTLAKLRAVPEVISFLAESRTELGLGSGPDTVADGDS